MSQALSIFSSLLAFALVAVVLGHLPPRQQSDTQENEASKELCQLLPELPSCNPSNLEQQPVKPNRTKPTNNGGPTPERTSCRGRRRRRQINLSSGFGTVTVPTRISIRDYWKKKRAGSARNAFVRFG